MTTEIEQQSSEDRGQRTDSDLAPPPLPRLLLPGEAQQLKACEEIIKRGLKIFLEVGFALISIRDRRLYRAEFDTWEEYCQERFGITARRATQLCAASETVRNLGLGASGASNRNPGSDSKLPNRNYYSSGLVLPANEAQVRPLAGLPPEEQRAAWAEAVATAPNGRVTRAHVEQIVQKRQQVADQIGTGVPISAPAGPAEPPIGSPPEDVRGMNGKGISPDPDSSRLQGAPKRPFGAAAAAEHSGPPLRPKETRESLAIAQADRTIADILELQQICGTPDSEAEAGMQTALECIEAVREHQTKLKNLQASRT